jgi:hypothetical protein
MNDTGDATDHLIASPERAASAAARILDLTFQASVRAHRSPSPTRREEPATQPIPVSAPSMTITVQ